MTLNWLFGELARHRGKFAVYHLGGPHYVVRHTVLVDRHGSPCCPAEAILLPLAEPFARCNSLAWRHLESAGMTRVDAELFVDAADSVNGMLRDRMLDVLGLTPADMVSAES